MECVPGTSWNDSKGDGRRESKHAGIRGSGETGEIILRIRSRFESWPLHQTSPRLRLAGHFSPRLRLAGHFFAKAPSGRPFFRQGSVWQAIFSPRLRLAGHFFAKATSGRPAFKMAKPNQSASSLK